MNKKTSNPINKKLIIASILMIIHGGFMEAGTALFMIPLATRNAIDPNIVQNVFAIDFFADNIKLMMVMGLIFGIIRIVGAVGILKNRLWGFYLGMINCIVTMIAMMFMIPAGITDGILAGTAMVLLLQGYFGDNKIVPTEIGSL